MGIENEHNIMPLQSWLKTQTHLPQNIGEYLQLINCRISVCVCHMASC